MMTANICTKESAPEFRKCSAGMMWLPTWSQSLPLPVWLLLADPHMLWAKDSWSPAKKLQQHLQTTVIEDLSQKALGVQISLIKMETLQWARWEGVGWEQKGRRWREEKERETVINILLVFSNTGRLTPSGERHLMDCILGWKVRLIQCNERWMGLEALNQPQETPYKRASSFSH